MLAYMNSEHTEDPIVQVALAHYQFETIHPFGDGNGRIGRLLIILHLMQLGLLDKPLVYPSAYIEKHRDKYYSALQGVRDQAKWLDWIEFFLRTLKAQASETIRVSSKLLELRAKIRFENPSRIRSESIDAVLSSFFEEPVSTPSEIALRVGLSYNTVRKSLEILESEDIVFRISRHKRSALFGCAPLLKILFNES
jgi:Fic family protein